jgi:2-methylisocitrate lyase-like PEP mutase family enzyme
MLDPAQQDLKAKRFGSLHHLANTLLLPNAWDVASARIFEAAGFTAVATTSAGIAFAFGYPDGQKITREEMLGVVARIASAVKLPVTADVEAGYGDRPQDAAETARQVMEAGAVGMNLEDGTQDPDHPLAPLSLQLEKIAAVREEAAAAKVSVVLNARTDVYLAQAGPVEKRYDEALARLSSFRDGGADCVFAPGLQDRATIQRLVSDLACPLNILAGPGCPTVTELEKVGVSRVSLGSAPMRATLGLVQRIAQELKATGTYGTLDGSMPYADVNRLLA